MTKIPVFRRRRVWIILGRLWVGLGIVALYLCLNGLLAAVCFSWQDPPYYAQWVGIWLGRSGACLSVLLTGWGGAHYLARRLALK